MKRSLLPPSGNFRGRGVLLKGQLSGFAIYPDACEGSLPIQVLCLKSHHFCAGLACASPATSSLKRCRDFQRAGRLLLRREARHSAIVKWLRLRRSVQKPAQVFWYCCGASLHVGYAVPALHGHSSFFLSADKTEMSRPLLQNTYLCAVSLICRSVFLGF